MLVAVGLFESETGGELKLGLAIVPLAVGNVSSTVPKAYLQYILTDSKGNVTHSKRRYITTLANNAWESMSMSYTAETEGYLQVFVANESDRAVWFDEVQLTVNPGLIVQETHYDPWGVELAGIEGRGSPEHKFKFQGKELTDEIGLYLMDFHARQYDAQLGRWHAPDPKGYLRPHHSPYMSMGNDPINNIDPDGEFFFGTLLAPLSGFVRGITRVAQGDGIKGFFQGYGEGLWNGIKIDAGNFAWDSNLNFGKNLLAIGSRFTWQAPQQFIGNLYNAAQNATGQVEWVRYKYGATVVSSGIQPGGITLGSYITGRSGRIRADENNELFQHEYGHVLQSRSMGPAYLWRVGHPSLFDNDSYGDHDFHPVELDANLRAFKYFNEHIPGFYESPVGSGQPNAYNAIDGRGWDFFRNPLDPTSTGRRERYWDYRNQNHMQTLNGLRVRARWYDYAFGVFAGIYNTFRYNNP